MERVPFLAIKAQLALVKDPDRIKLLKKKNLKELIRIVCAVEAMI